MNWKENYASKRVGCGDALELHGAADGTGRKLIQQWFAYMVLGKDYCTDFFERIDDNFCMNAGSSALFSDQVEYLENSTFTVGTLRGNQWCYVSKECADLNGGEKMTDAKVNWKICKEGEDKLLLQAPPPLLAQFAKQVDVNMAQLVKFAYPDWVGDKWQDIQGLLGLGGEAPASPLPPSSEDAGQGPTPPLLKLGAREKIDQLTKAGHAFVFNSKDDGRPPYTVAYGRQAWLVHGSLGFNQSHPGSWKELECVSGCGA